MIYNIDNYYYEDSNKYCIMMECDKQPQEVVEITSAIQFLFEDIFEVGDCLDDKCLKKILIDYYGMKDVKQQYCTYLPKIRDFLAEEGWELINIFTFDELVITQVDMSEGRESCCASYKDIMKKWLPTGNELESLKVLLQEEGQECCD